MLGCVAENLAKDFTSTGNRRAVRVLGKQATAVVRVQACGFHGVQVTKCNKWRNHAYLFLHEQ